MIYANYNMRMGAKDPEFIDADNSWEINYWSAKLHCTKKELIVAAREVGPRMEDVKAFITLIQKTKIVD